MLSDAELGEQLRVLKRLDDTESRYFVRRLAVD
jgi:hypothetical protein